MEEKDYPPEQSQDAPSLPYALASFFFPLVGFSLWLLFQGRYPKKAGSALKGAVIGGVVLMGLTILVVISIVTTQPHTSSLAPLPH